MANPRKSAGPRPASKAKPVPGPSPGPDPVASAVAQMANLLESEDQTDLSISKEDEHAEPRPDTPEYFELPDSAIDSVQYDESHASFDAEPTSLPRLMDLPRSEEHTS